MSVLSGTMVVVSRARNFREGLISEGGGDWLPHRDKGRWGINPGLIDPPVHTLRGIIQSVGASRPSAKVDKVDTLGVPYGRVVYTACNELELTVVFAGSLGPAIGDTLTLYPHVEGRETAFRISDILDQWEEGRFCVTKLQCSGKRGWGNAPAITKITGLDAGGTGTPGGTGGEGGAGTGGKTLYWHTGTGSGGDDSGEGPGFDDWNEDYMGDESGDGPG